MRGSKWENLKSGAIAVLLGLLAMAGITWRSTGCMICGGYLVSQITWVYLVSYDEIQRKRRQSRKNDKMGTN